LGFGFCGICWFELGIQFFVGVLVLGFVGFVEFVGLSLGFNSFVGVLVLGFCGGFLWDLLV